MTSVAALGHVELQRIPRHQFARTGVYCGVEGHAKSCLCDVELPDVLAPVMGRAPLFAKLALDVLDDEHVSATNFHEFASIMLGCYDKFVTLPQRVVTTESLESDGTLTERFEWWLDNGAVQQEELSGPPAASKTPWSCLPQSIQDRLVEAYKVVLPWEAAKLALPAWVPVLDVLYIKHAYQVKASKFRTRKIVATQVAEMEMAA